MQSDASRPDQLANALKRLTAQTDRVSQPAQIDHGHGEPKPDTPGILWPEHLLRAGREEGQAPPELTANVGRYTAKDGNGETATDPS